MFDPSRASTMLLELRFSLLLFQLEHPEHLWRKSMGANTWNTVSASQVSLWLFGTVQTQRGTNHRPQVGSQSRIRCVRWLSDMCRVQMAWRILCVEIERVPEVGPQSHHHKAQAKSCRITACDKVRCASRHWHHVPTQSRL